MTSRRLSTPSGQSVTLGAELGKGGEGTVYEVVGSPDLVAKLYTDGRAEDRRAKIEAMVTAGLHHQAPHISFPIEVLLDESRSFVGFTMRRVRGARPIHQLWNSRDRQEKFPDATVSFMVRVAANAARTVAELHHTGCVIGDINESGFLVTDQATVILIDSDSIQYSANGQVFPCVVGTPEYLPPEHQGVNQRNLGTRDANHDNFGLAVMIFRILMSGAHPFRGVWKGRGEPPAPPKWIEEFRYAYGSDSSRLKVAPQPTAPPVDWLPDDVRDAFERAFGGSGARQRPAARDWIDMLDRFEKVLVQCRKSRFHHHRTGTRNCPWCETEKKRGRELFGQVKTSYQRAPLGGASRGAGSRGPTGPSAAPAPANSPPTPPPRQGANNGLRNAILAIIGIAIVSLFVFGRNQGQDTATNTATAPPQTTPRQSAGVQARVPQNGSVIALSVSTPSDPILLPQGRCIRWSSNADIVQDYGLETFNLNSNAFEFDRNRFWNYWTADTAIDFWLPVKT
jgi:DNA-binding helix-hairpin-helix protein with protein kinase domain